MDEQTKVLGELIATDLFDDFLEESEHHELHGDAARDATLHHVEELVLIDVTGRCTVGAAHVVGQNLKAWKGVGIGAWVEQQVAVGLIRVSLLRAFGDFDQAGEDGACIIQKCILIGQIGYRVGRSAN